MREHGCVLFRGFDVDRDSFEETVSAGFDSDRFVWMFAVPPRYARILLRLPVIGWINRTLLGWIESRATGRRLVGKKQSTLANDQTMQFPHHEYVIFFNVPLVLAFHCEAASEIEGETPNPIEASDWRWVDPDALFRELDEHPERFTYWFREVAERVEHHVGHEWASRAMRTETPPV